MNDTWIYNEIQYYRRWVEVMGIDYVYENELR